MRQVAILAILLILGGCAGPQIRDYTAEERERADRALAEYIEKNRQIVFMPNDWQVMAYCKGKTVEKAVEKGATLLCKPPKRANTDVTMKASVFVLLKRLTVKPGHPAAWYARFDNFTEHNICLNAQWRLMDIKAQDELSEWHVVPARSRLGVGYMRQEIWQVDDKVMLLDFAGHVAGLLVRPVSRDGSCFESLEYEEEDEIRPDQ